MEAFRIASEIAPAGKTNSALSEPLVPIAIAGLERTFNPETCLYDLQIRHARIEPTWGTEDLTSTCICLIGMDRHDAGDQWRPDMRSVLHAAIALAARRRYHGGFGLLLWASAVLDGPRVDELAREAKFPLHVDQCYDQLTTMELAWFVSGLLHELLRTREPRVENLARSALAALSERFAVNSGIMRHATAAAPLGHRLRNRIANFADQIYSVQAFSFSAIVLGNAKAGDLATRLAKKMIELQGPLGQWWWHYDAASGLVSEKYPVYSVHQHAMAPMALMAAEAAGGPCFADAIERSYAWLKRNELGADMIDVRAGTIWRDIEVAETRLAALLRKASELAGVRAQETDHALEVNHETRPYEWAWLLYAAAISGRHERKRHIV